MRRKAFTTLELMIVVGIIVVLAGMVIWGLSAAGSHAAANSTRTTLQNLTNMLEELNRKDKLAGIEGPPPVSGQSPPLFVVDLTVTPIIGGEIAPSIVTDGMPDRTGDAVRRTGEVIRRLQSLPDNRKVLEKLPSDQLMTVGHWPVPQPPASDPPENTVVRDAWHNPILFVPSAGLRNVWAKTTIATYSSGTTYQRGARVLAKPSTGGSSEYMVYWTALTSTSNAPSAPDWFEGIRSPDGRPFWASAGPDGGFGVSPGSDGNLGTKDDVPFGDDNIYSFDQ